MWHARLATWPWQWAKALWRAPRCMPLSSSTPEARGMRDQPSPFMDAVAMANYATDTPRKVPGLADLHRMATLLLGEQAPGAAHVLVVGAGGGLELLSLAAARPDWRFTGVDPSPA